MSGIFYLFVKALLAREILSEQQLRTDPGEICSRLRYAEKNQSLHSHH